ncbi:MAG: RNA-binding S4 domain-containing protein [Desulfuromonadaceae bacterium]|nr:RNA-binding S4 domain-containing protein [Desulfuromonadaceae bacterium]
MNVPIATGYIKLDSFLKMINAVCSGGEAKSIIAEGEVSVNGAVEIRRGRKLYPGDRIRLGESEYLLKSD